MAPRDAGMARFGLPVLPLLFAIVLLAGCGGSSGVHTQTPTSGPVSSTGESSTPTASTSTTNPSTASTNKDVPTPTVTAPAQDAVNAYITFYNVSNAADIDPAHAELAKMNSLLTGKALTLFDGVLASLKKNGIAYRGTPPNPHVKVGSILSPTFMYLASCPKPLPSDEPFVQYYVATGKIVPVTKPAVAPPYKVTVPMKKVNGSWKVADVLVDTSKTCTV
jgi:hypothetical protein